MDNSNVVYPQRALPPMKGGRKSMGNTQGMNDGGAPAEADHAMPEMGASEKRDFGANSKHVHPARKAPAAEKVRDAQHDPSAMKAAHALRKRTTHRDF